MAVRHTKADLFGLKPYLGASDESIEQLYWPVLNSYFSRKLEAKETTLQRLATGLFVRRQYVLPCFVDPENHHKNKGLWEYTVFLSGLLLNKIDDANPEDQVNRLLSPLNKKHLSWYKSSGEAYSALLHIDEVESLEDENAARIRVVYGLDEPDQIAQAETEGEASVSPKPTNTEEQVTRSEPKRTLKQRGAEILEWMQMMSNKGQTWVQVKEGKLHVLTPLAFQRYEKYSGLPWQRAQKALLKLNKHETLNNQPFIKIENSNYVVLGLA